MGLETTLQSKKATIEDLGINLNNTQLERERMALIASNLSVHHPVHHPYLGHSYVSPLTGSYLHATTGKKLY